MRRLLPIVAVLAGTLALSGSASAAQGGYDVPTKRLEGVFKIALFERAGSDDGCYPSPNELLPKLEGKTTVQVKIAPSFKAIKKAGVVYIIGGRTNCNRLVEGLVYGGKLFVLDSNYGPVYVQGNAKKETAVGMLTKLKNLTTASSSLTLDKPDQVQRLTVECPGKTAPVGGGMLPGTISPDGEGIYPHSYERLGVQLGWHVSAVLIDPSHASTGTHRATVEVMCARGVPQPVGPRKTVFVKSGQTKSATARCPGKTFLMAGGFQRTDFRTPGGDYITESRAISPKAWRVTGHAFGDFGGELTAMAYCVRHKGPVFQEVSASNPVPLGQTATASTPTCPKGRRLTSTGFSMNGSEAAFFGGSTLNADGTSTATGFGYFGAAPSMTAYGYCQIAS